MLNILVNQNKFTKFISKTMPSFKSSEQFEKIPVLLISNDLATC